MKTLSRTAVSTALAFVVVIASTTVAAHAAEVPCSDVPTGWECTPLINKGNPAPLGELFFQRTGSTLLMATHLFTEPDTSHTDAKLCVDDDNDPWSSETSCVGGTKGLGTFSSAVPACVNASTVGEEDDEPKGNYEYMLEGAALPQTTTTTVGDLGTLGLFTACVSDYDVFSLHFNQGLFSIESFFTTSTPAPTPPEVTATIVCTTDENGDAVFTLDVDAPEGVTTDPADGDTVTNEDQTVTVTWTGGTFDIDVEATEDCSDPIIPPLPPEVTATIVCTTDENGDAVFTLDVDAPEGVTTDPADGDTVTNEDQTVLVTWSEGTFEIDVEATEDCSDPIIPPLPPEVTATIICTADENGEAAYTLDVDAPEGVTTDPADGATVTNVDQTIVVTWSEGTFEVDVEQVPDCSFTPGITKAQPNITTVPSAGGTVGVVLTDTAFVSGGDNPTGTVTFELFYHATETSCEGEPVFTTTANLINGQAVTATGHTTTLPGVYNWVATYNGDENNLTAQHACGEEEVRVTRVLGGGPLLPRTGAETEGIFRLALLLLVAGAMLLAVARRRPTPHLATVVTTATSAWPVDIIPAPRSTPLRRARHERGPPG